MRGVAWWHVLTVLATASFCKGVGVRDQRLQQASIECNSAQYAFRVCKLRHVVLWKGKIWLPTTGKLHIPDVRLHDFFLHNSKNSQDVQLRDIAKLVAPADLPVLNAANVSHHAHAALIWRLHVANWYHAWADTAANTFIRLCTHFGYCEYGAKGFEDMLLVWLDPAPWQWVLPAVNEAMACFGRTHVSLHDSLGDVAYVIDELLVGVGNECRTSYCYDRQEGMHAITPQHLEGWVRFARRCVGLPAEPPMRMAKPRVVFLNRAYQAGRSVLTMGEAYAHFHVLGGQDWGASYELVYLEGASLREQAALFNQADILVIPHGAAVADLTFLPHASVVVDVSGHEAHQSFNVDHLHLLKPFLNTMSLSIMLASEAELEPITGKILRLEDAFRDWPGEEKLAFLLSADCPYEHEFCRDVNIRSKLFNYPVPVSDIIGNVTKALHLWGKQRKQRKSASSPGLLSHSLLAAREV
ncbi:hypothetical protein WJX72_010240 [[Myrmecia] bisecta]|uniref:Glycosyltransferase 61 catalytic domain-containing protein n=1 Tax=[Myrmecia] bisecta TaxID=41462 RepID=A0AAW1PL40_9CHLO